LWVCLGAHGASMPGHVPFWGHGGVDEEAAASTMSLLHTEDEEKHQNTRSDEEIVSEGWRKTQRANLSVLLAADSERALRFVFCALPHDALALRLAVLAGKISQSHLEAELKDFARAVAFAAEWSSSASGAGQLWCQSGSCEAERLLQWQPRHWIFFASRFVSC